jgi:hypothetical protein
VACSIVVIMSSQTSKSLVWSVFNWNICGINDKDNWPLLRNKLEESGASVICLQETKKTAFDNSSIRKLLQGALIILLEFPRLELQVVCLFYGTVKSSPAKCSCKNLLV